MGRGALACVAARAGCVLGLAGLEVLGAAACALDAEMGVGAGAAARAAVAKAANGSLGAGAALLAEVNAAPSGAGVAGGLDESLAEATDAADSGATAGATATAIAGATAEAAVGATDAKPCSACRRAGGFWFTTVMTKPASSVMAPKPIKTMSKRLGPWRPRLAEGPLRAGRCERRVDSSVDRIRTRWVSDPGSAPSSMPANKLGRPWSWLTVVLPQSNFCMCVQVGAFYGVNSFPSRLRHRDCNQSLQDQK